VKNEKLFHRKNASFCKKFAQKKKGNQGKQQAISQLFRGVIAWVVLQKIFGNLQRSFASALPFEYFVRLGC